MDGLLEQDRMTDTSAAPAVKNLPQDVARAVELMHDRKANDVVLMDLRKISSATDFFLIASGTSDTHVASIADHVVDELKQAGTPPPNVEGPRGGRRPPADGDSRGGRAWQPAARHTHLLARLW